MTKVVLTVRKVQFRYPGNTAQLYLENLELKQGDKVFVEAPSGAGKTTLLSLIAGVLVPDKGSIELLGQPFSSLSENQRDYLRGCHIGYIFQQFNLLPSLTVRENLLLLETIAPDRFRGMSKAEKREQWKTLEEILQLKNYLDRPARQLSTGESQRVAVMRALLGRPSLVLADEPTSALDTTNRDKFISLLEELCEREGIALLFVSHDVQLRAKFDFCLPLPPMQNNKAK